MTIRPAPRPCGSCPYRRDVPSGVWAEDEYAKLPPYDGETWEQPPTAFMCHQQDGRLCAGWVAVHDMEHSFGLRMLTLVDQLDADTVQAIVEYTTDVPLFASGAEAAAHGLAEVDQPGEQASRIVDKLERRRAR